MRVSGESLGQRVRARHKALKLSQEALAARMEMRQSGLSRIEMDRSQDIEGRILIRLATALGGSTDYPLGLTDDPYGSHVYAEPQEPDNSPARARAVALA